MPAWVHPGRLEFSSKPGALQAQLLEAWYTPAPNPSTLAHSRLNSLEGLACSRPKSSRPGAAPDPNPQSLVAPGPDLQSLPRSRPRSSKPDTLQASILEAWRASGRNPQSLARFRPKSSTPAVSRPSCSRPGASLQHSRPLASPAAPHPSHFGVLLASKWKSNPKNLMMNSSRTKCLKRLLGAKLKVEAVSTECGAQR